MHGAGATQMRLRLAVGALAVLVAVPAGAGPTLLKRADLRWLGRVTFGVDSAAVDAYRRLGREKFLDAQLHPPREDPDPLRTAIAALGIEQKPAEARVREVRQE